MTIPVQYIEVKQNRSAVQVQSLVLDISDSVGWVLNSNGLYEYTLYDSHITTDSVVQIVPNNEDVDVIRTAVVLPECKIFEDGNIVVYSENEPTGNINVTLDIWKKETGSLPTIGSFVLPMGGGSSFSIPEKDFEWCITAGVEQTETIDLYATAAYTIDKLIAESDGTLTSVTIKIDGVAVTGLNAVSVSTLASFTATALNTVAIGQRVTMVVGTGYSGTPTIIKAKLTIAA